MAGGDAETGAEAELVRRFGAEPFAILATHGRSGALDLVPCCFAVLERDGDLEVVTAIDHKPKRHQRLARLANVARDANVSLVVDNRDPDDWTNLWWVRLHGRAEIVDGGPDHEEAIAALVAKYPQYRETVPSGPVIRIRPIRWSGWTPAGT